ncbi:hypothetical protein N9V13_05245 [Betaproteobacteria bacterium]|nr:hypothetical protein [Betaproteobacteria bacterium]
MKKNRTSLPFNWFSDKQKDNKKYSSEELQKWGEAFTFSMDKDARDLYVTWMSFSDNMSIKASSYFQAYSDLLSKYRDQKVILSEVGVFRGGSLLTWRKWLGEQSKIIGIDLNPGAKKYATDDIDIVIGDQADPNFWKAFFSHYPDVDIIIDDGGHQFFQQVITFFSVLIYGKRKMMLIFEDVNTSFFKDFRAGNDEVTFFEFVKDLTDNLTLKQVFGSRYGDKWVTNVKQEVIKRYSAIRSVSFFSGIVAIIIDPDFCYTPQYLKNTSRNHGVPGERGKGDYRHEGEIGGVSFPWPNPHDNKTVRFKDPLLKAEKKILKIK